MTTVLRSGFGPELADCSRCELRGSCKQRAIQGERPEGWEPGGLMLIGEGPGRMEASLLKPFVGQSGQLLNALLENAGIDRQKCWVTNATMGLPPYVAGDSGGLHERFPNAIYSCLPRLEAEIAAAQPRVIVTLGQAALVALAGHTVERKRMVAVACNNTDCDPESRKLRAKGLECAFADCDWMELCGDDPDRVKLAHGGKCPKCKASITRLRPKAVKCPTCGGKKRRIEDYTSFEHDMVLVGRNGVAGAVFEAASLPSRLDALGVHYVLPTYHPSFALRPAPVGAGDKKRIGGQFAARVIVEHLEKAARLLRSEPTFRARPLLTTDPAVVRKFLERLDVRYAVDIEGNSHDGSWGQTKITVFGVAVLDSEEALVVDTRNASEELLDVIQDFLEDARRRKFFHNGQFDRVVIRRLWGMEVVGCDTDTIISHHSLYPDEEHGLGFLAHELLDAPHWKVKKRNLKPGEKDDLGGYQDFNELALYNARDTRATVLCDRIMFGDPDRGVRGRLDIENVRRSHDVDVQMQEVSVEMELMGMPLDTERVRECAVHCEGKRAELLAEMQDMVGRRTDAAGGPWLDENGELWEPSGKALLWALFDKDGPLRLEPFAWTSGGKSGVKQPSTAKEALARMVDQHPFIPKLIEYKRYAYVLTNYIHGAALRAQADGRLHPQWKVYGTGTTRWTSNPNFQNWSKAQDSKDELLNLRSLIAAPPGRRLVGADYAQLELRVVGDLSGDEKLIQRLLQADEARKLEPEWDPHAYMAFRTFGAAYSGGDKTKKKALRDVVKRVVYGLNYGAGAETVLEAIYNGGYDGPPITLAMIQLIIKTYFEEYPGIVRWRENTVRRAEETWEVRSSLLHSRRIFPLGDIDITVAYNFDVQASAANIMNTRLGVLFPRLRQVDPSAFFIAQVHDAVYIEASEERAEAVCKLVSESLTCELSLSGGPTMIYSASADHARRWDEC